MRHLLDFLLKYDYWLLFLLLEAAGLLLFFRYSDYPGSVLFSSANRVSGMFYEAVSEVTGYFGLRDVNRGLVQRNVELELRVVELERSLSRFRADTSVVSRLHDVIPGEYAAYPATVVNASLTRRDNWLTLEGGSQAGIRPEMGVVDGRGVVGIVYRVSSRYSVVLPILNSKSSISCKIHRTGYFGSLKWEGGSPAYAVLMDIPRHSEFSLGDTVVTSGHSSIFPEGIPVGTVDDMEDSNDGLSYRLKIRLFTDFGRLGDVRVISSVSGRERRELEKEVYTDKQ